MQSQQPDNQKNLMLAIVLSLGVLLGWQTFYAGPKLKEEQDRLKAQKEVAAQQAPTPSTAGAPATATGGQAPAAPGAGKATTGAAPGVASPVAGAMTRDAALKASPRVAIQTPSIKGSVSLKGGRIDDIAFVK